MKLRAAILEDNKQLLKDLKQSLEVTGLIEVVAWACNSDEFREKVEVTKPDAIILDIDLGPDGMTGIDVAHELKLPVLFVSGKTRDYLQGIEDLNLNSSMTVEHVSKPISVEKLNKILPKFINEIRLLHKAQYVYLDFGETKQNKIAIDSIVCLHTDKNSGAESNNKLIFFADRKYEILVDFSFSKMEACGLSKNQFITIHKSYRVNADKILRYHTSSHELEVTVFKSLGKTDLKLLPVSENFRNDVSRFRK